MKSCEFEFVSRGRAITVSFSKTGIEIADKYREVTYCTIAVKDADGKFHYYHDGVVWDCKDKWNERTAYFLAFKKALRQRYEDYVLPTVKTVDICGDLLWDKYHHWWAHYLSALIDGEVKYGFSSTGF
jgi:hypothetical protein